MAGITFKRGVKAPLPPGSIVSAPLGDTILLPLAQNDVGKAIIYQAGTGGDAVGTLEAVLAGDNADIEGFISSVEPNTVNSGYSFGGVQEKGQYEVEKGATAGAVVLGGFVQMDGAQAARGVAETTLPKVKAFVPDATTVIGTPLWKVTQILTGDGTTAGDNVLIERVA